MAKHLVRGVVKEIDLDDDDLDAMIDSMNDHQKSELGRSLLGDEEVGEHVDTVLSELNSDDRIEFFKNRVDVIDDPEEARAVFEYALDRHKKLVIEQTICPGCGCKPGDGRTSDCNNEDGCGYFKQIEANNASI